MTALTGALVGLVLGVAVDAGVWLWAFSEALSGRTVVQLPLIVTTDVEHGDVVASTGVGVIAIPVIAAILVGAVGWLVGRRAAAGSDADHDRSGHR